jgi:Spy/CpxP family protein refolding chaperone
MRTKFFILSILLFSGLLFSNASIAQDKKHCEKKCNHEIEGLTEVQTSKIKSIVYESDKKIALNKADLKIKKAELEKLKIVDNPSQKDINTKIDEISKLKGDIEKEKVSKEIAIKNELTPEQKNVFKVKSVNKHVKRTEAMRAIGAPASKNIEKKL